MQINLSPESRQLLLRLLRTHQAALNKTISEHTHPDFAVALHEEWALTDTLISLLEEGE
jgi:hypothetical protein